MADDSNTTLRVCSKCGIEKPHTLEFFPGTWLRGVKRVGARCRPCSTEDQRERYRKNPDRMKSWLRAYRKKHPEKVRAWDKANAEKNKGAGSEYEKRRYAARDKKAAREALREWKKANPEKVSQMWQRTYAKHREKHIKRRMEWAKKNPESVAAIRDRRRAKELGNQGSYTREEIRCLLKRQGRICFYCGCRLEKFHADHFIPLARGGRNTIENIRLSCPSCNFSKAARMPWEWMPGKFVNPDNRG